MVYDEHDPAYAEEPIDLDPCTGEFGCTPATPGVAEGLVCAEEWRAVPDWEGLYEVSNLGRVRSIDRVNHRGARMKGKVLKHATKTGGHRYVRLTRNATMHSYFVHRLVLSAFSGPRPPGLCACHNDGDPTNNRAENLRWDTHKGNMADRTKHGTGHRPAGATNGRARLTETQVVEIRARAAGGEPQVSLARAYNVGRSTINHVVSGDTWTSTDRTSFPQPE